MAMTITIEISDVEEKILKNELVDPDLWVKQAAEGKINNIWKRMQSSWVTTLMNDDSFTDAIPSNQTDFVALVTAREDYKTAAENAAEDTV
tara:strand:- start:200 stop:472 length:273 start_codon:yes stop_codon:yes gene_type:complete